LNFVAGLGQLIGRKGGEGENAFGLVSDVEDNGVGSEGDNGGFAALSAGFALAGMAVLVLGENILKGFDGGWLGLG
jgi:hypothetical protein